MMRFSWVLLIGFAAPLCAQVDSQIDAICRAAVEGRAAASGGLVSELPPMPGSGDRGFPGRAAAVRGRIWSHRPGERHLRHRGDGVPHRFRDQAVHGSRDPAAVGARRSRPRGSHRQVLSGLSSARQPGDRTPAAQPHFRHSQLHLDPRFHGAAVQQTALRGGVDRAVPGRAAALPARRTIRLQQLRLLLARRFGGEGFGSALLRLPGGRDLRPSRARCDLLRLERDADQESGPGLRDRRQR